MSLVILHCINTMIIYTINIIIQILIFDSQLILTINNLINGQCASVPKLCDNNVESFQAFRYFVSNWSEATLKTFNTVRFLCLKWSFWWGLIMFNLSYTISQTIATRKYKAPIVKICIQSAWSSTWKFLNLTRTRLQPDSPSRF
jgi:hypothetical protein